MKLEDLAKQAALEAAVAHSLRRERRNPARAARNLADLAAALTGKDEDGALILLKAEFWR